MRIAATVILGVHGRKRSGPGETFWQYRPYSFGDSVQHIDWHRSARSDRVFIRENEWEAANTLWLWVSPSVSMTFRSHLASVTKSERAKLLALAVASLAVRAHERVSILGSGLDPAHSRPALCASRGLADNAAAHPTSLPRAIKLPRFSTVLMLGDFLEKPELIAASLGTIAAEGVAGHMVQVCDPAEETLPYAGRVEFRRDGGAAALYCRQDRRPARGLSGEVRRASARRCATSPGASAGPSRPSHQRAAAARLHSCMA